MPPFVKTHEEMVTAVPSNASAAVAFLSEVGYDTEYFDPVAYANLVLALRRYPGLTGVVLDGAISRLDRPEFLADELTYWKGTSVEEAKLLMQRVPSHKHTASMLDAQLDILSNRLGELRRALPDVTIVYKFHDDDLQYTISKIMNERMLAQATSLTEAIGMSELKIKEHKARCSEAKSDLKTLESQSGKPVRRKRENAKERLQRNGDAIDKLRGHVEQLKVDRQYFRESKSRPLHQTMTEKFMEELFGRVRAICAKHSVVLVTGDALLRFGGLSFHYMHSGHKTWGVVKRRPHNLREGVQSHMRSFFKDLTPAEKDKEAEDRKAGLVTSVRQRVDAVVESGHSGRPFVSVLKCHTLFKELNFRNASVFDGEVGDRYVHVVSVMPFESRRKIGAYVDGRQHVRMSGGKPGGSRNSRAVDRYHQSVTAGLTIITKGDSGRVGTHWVRYADFESGTGILPTPHVIASSSDEHIGSVFAQPTVLQGWVSLVTRLASEDFPFLTQGARVVGVILPGDQVDANTDKWVYGREARKRNPLDVHKEVITRLARMDPTDESSVREMAAYAANVAGGGTVESMDDIMDWATDYMWDLMMAVLPRTMLQFALVRIPGNHSGGALARLGMNSNAFLRQRLKVLEIPYYLVANPDYIDPKEYENARVLLGGFGISLVGGVETYGLAKDGSTLFGPIRLYANHNPKGPDMLGLINTGKGAGADVVVAGHTHEFYVCPYLMGDDDVGFAVRVATLSKVTDVELYYASGLLRVQGATLMAMPAPGQFAEEFVFVHKLREEGQKAQSLLIQDAISEHD